MIFKDAPSFSRSSSIKKKISKAREKSEEGTETELATLLRQKGTGKENSKGDWLTRGRRVKISGVLLRKKRRSKKNRCKYMVRRKTPTPLHRLRRNPIGKKSKRGVGGESRGGKNGRMVKGILTPANSRSSRINRDIVRELIPWGDRITRSRRGR